MCSSTVEVFRPLFIWNCFQYSFAIAMFSGVLGWMFSKVMYTPLGFSRSKQILVTFALSGFVE